jgi:hemoglobin-like flavoprotein
MGQANVSDPYPTKVGVRYFLIPRKVSAMTTDQIHLLRKSFARVEPQAQVAALVFYRRLFELDPSLRPLFKTDIEVQGRKLMDMLGAALSLTERPGALEKELLNAGARHVRYGTMDEHYPTVGQAMLDMLAEVLGDEFTPATRQAWTEFYTYTAETMKRGAAQVKAMKGSTESTRTRTPAAA